MSVRRLALAALVPLWLLAAAPVYAAKVMIVRPSSSPPAMIETLVRLKGELISAGFETEIVDAAATRQGADAIITIVGESPPDIEVLVFDKATGKTAARRLPFEPAPSRASKTLAIRAIELLRSSFLEFDLAAHERQSDRPNDDQDKRAVAQTPALVHHVETQPPAALPERFGVEVGATAVMSLDGVGPAVMPLVRFDWSPRSWFVAQAAIAGLGTRPTVEGKAGSAQVAQAHGLLGGSFRFRPAARVRPFATFSAGALRTAVEGRADAPNHGQAAEQWSFLLDAGLGAFLRLPDRFYLSLAVHAQLAEPFLAVRFLDAVVATSGRPNLLLSLTVGAWL